MIQVLLDVKPAVTLAWRAGVNPTVTDAGHSGSERQNLMRVMHDKVGLEVPEGVIEDEILAEHTCASSMFERCSVDAAGIAYDGYSLESPQAFTHAKVPELHRFVH